MERLRSQLRLAYRNLGRQKGRTLATMGAIALGVAALILSGGFVRDILAQLAEALIHSQSGHVQVAKAGFFGSTSRSPESAVLERTAELVDDLGRQPETVAVMARLNFAGLLGNGRTDLPIVGEGVEPAKEAALGTRIVLVEGRQLTDKDRFGILVGQGVAKALKLRLGDPVTLVANTREGSLNTADLEVVGVFQTFSREYDAHAVRVPIGVARELLDTQGTNLLVVSLARTRDTDAFAERLQATAKERGIEVRTWRDLNDFYDKSVRLYDYQFGFLRLVILVMVLLSVTNIVSMTLFERAGEFGTMRALGNNHRDVVGLILVEGMVLGVFGAAAGVLVGTVLALAISTIGIPMPPPPNSDMAYTARIQLGAGLIAASFAVGLAAAVLGSVLPGLRIARMPLTEALRQNV